MNVQDLVDHAIAAFKKHDVFFGHGTESAEDEAWWLVSGALELPIDEAETYLSTEVNEEDQKKIEALIKKRSIEKIPTAYLLKEAYLDGLKFYVDERVLIPRSPIAELIQKRFAPWLGDVHVQHILDLCTGSACLAILCADYFPEAQVDASDYSPEALEVAEKNIQSFNLQERVHLIQSDLFNAMPERKYEIIVSNPPYVDEQDLQTMPEEYRHEPREALAAGKEGLDLVSIILKEAKGYLADQGLLILEVGNSQAALEAAYPHLPFIWVDLEAGGEGVCVLKKEDLA